MRRSQFLQAAAAALGLPAASRAAAPVPRLRGLRASNGGRPFAGDGPYLTTISPRRAARRRALISFSLTGRARVRLEVVRTDTIRVGKPLAEVVWSTERSFAAGTHEVAWRPPRDLQPRTYQVRAVVSAGGRHRTYGVHRPGSKVSGPVVRVLGVEVALTKTSYAPGEPTDLRIASDSPSLELQVFHYAGPERFVERDLRTNGVAVTPPAHVDWRAHRDAPSRLRFRRPGSGAAASASSARGLTTGTSATRRSSCARARSVSTGSPSSSRRTRGRPTTSTTPTATAGATAGTSARAPPASTSRVRSSTSECRFAFETGFSRSSRG